SGNTVTNNTISNNGTNGIEISAASNNTITGNTITGNSNGLLVRRTSIVPVNNSINENNISGNTGYGLSTDITGADPAIDATTNWWGAVSGPGEVGTGTGDKVSTGVSFSPWYINAEKTTRSNSITLTVNSGGNGTAGPAGTYSYGDVVTLTNSPATNYHFVNWTGDADCTDGSVTMNANVTCTANFAIDTHIVTFDKNGGTTESDPTTRTTNYNTTVTLPTAPTKIGYTFDSWKTAADGSGTTFNASTPVTDNVIVYAKWMANQTIIFGTLGGKTYGNIDFLVSATSDSGLTVAFAAQTLGVCTVTDTTVHIVSAGDCTIRASQAGNGIYNPAGNVDQTFTIAKATPIIVVTPYSVTYDANPHTASGTAKGVSNEDLVGLVLTGTTHTNAGDYPTDAWGYTDVTGNYNNASGTVHDAIAQKQLTIASPDLTLSKTYDGSTTAVVTAGALGEVISPDVVTVSAIANYDTDAIGTGKTITIVYTLGGASFGNYIKPVNGTNVNGIILSDAQDIPDESGDATQQSMSARLLVTMKKEE
ncbi:MAG: InlB B-repeat-containing protein, partial [Candidatus Shapirobacteria bacterium]|nr:InlB B-repeat-containing protein [Candidatus Shapirobacteria bacterium]